MGNIHNQNCLDLFNLYTQKYRVIIPCYEDN